MYHSVVAYFLTISSVLHYEFIANLFPKSRIASAILFSTGLGPRQEKPK